jgi:leucyl-tRNA synthetase
MKQYDHGKIEKKWQKEWEAKKTYQTLPASKAKGKKPFYVLDMFPYPSGAGLHVGHPRGYIGSDVIARKMRMQGYNVLHPMGYDAFGLPAEQYAIQNKIHPRKAVLENVKTFERQLSIMGLSYDWSRKINTTDPEYYKWTQWIFLQIYNSWFDAKKQKARSIDELISIFEKKGNGDVIAFTTYTKTFSAKEWKSMTALEKQQVLMAYRLAYEGYSEVNWCPELGTVLANDEIVDGPNGEPVSERGGYPVEKKSMRQWFMRITAYADRLLAGLDGLQWPEHIKEIQRNWIGRKEDGGEVSYTVRDAVFARQRYWGEPIPLSKDANGIIHEVSLKNLPLELPNVKSYEPSGTGESPLSTVPAWKKAGYETNTMPGWAGSSWYFLRYLDPKNKKTFADKKELAYWFGKNKGIDVYVGGAEHATGHLLYSRFWHKVLFDFGFVPNQEPFQLLRNQGIILASDGRKMSKRWGNVVNPDEIVSTYGADTLRVYEMFIGPFEASLPWQTESIIGSRRFIERVWRLSLAVFEKKSKQTTESALRALHVAIKKVSEDIADFSFNTAISAMMICLNELEKAEDISASDMKKFLQLLAPFAPHMTEELWQIAGEKKTINTSGWPAFDPKKLVSETMVIVVQVNGKVRAELVVSRTAAAEEIEQEALTDEKIKKILATAIPKRVIYVPGRLVNIVV